ncbi:hypothetical protein QVD17_33079 [Tagetes erecta]|uniref:Uncharacterized protein n=1 Tax=Tagetes erecta TaxID=13708 RepID=A0AAD8NKX3_TARER|nr:hypothetical protein QVD17_33079 [Tagetes erecta]
MPPPTPKSLQPPPCEQNHLHFHSAAATRGVFWRATVGGLGLGLYLLAHYRNGFKARMSIDGEKRKMDMAMVSDVLWFRLILSIYYCTVLYYSMDTVTFGIIIGIIILFFIIICFITIEGTCKRHR